MTAQVNSITTKDPFMIGERLNSKLSELGLTQQRAADRLGISQSRLNQYLKNRREPDSQMLCKICETFGITPNYLFGFEENSPAGLKIDKTALESAILFLKKYETAHRKSFSAEQSARIISVVYDIVLSESAENAQKAIDWVIEAVA